MRFIKLRTAKLRNIIPLATALSFPLISYIAYAESYKKFDTNCCQEDKNFVKNTLKKREQIIWNSAEISILKHDVDNDGFEDIFARVSSVLNCGSSGCPIYLFEKDNYFYLFHSHDRIGFTDSKNEKYDTIRLLGDNGGECFWLHKNGKYSLDKCIVAIKSGQFPK